MMVFRTMPTQSRHSVSTVQADAANRDLSDTADTVSARWRHTSTETQTETRLLRREGVRGREPVGCGYTARHRQRRALCFTSARWVHGSTEKPAPPGSALAGPCPG